MGSWRITIEGHGLHHNRLKEDANVMASEFVEQLKASGHDHVTGKFELTSAMEPDALGAEHLAKFGPDAPPPK